MVYPFGVHYVFTRGCPTGSAKTVGDKLVVFAHRRRIDITHSRLRFKGDDVVGTIETRSLSKRFKWMNMKLPRFSRHLKRLDRDSRQEVRDVKGKTWV